MSRVSVSTLALLFAALPGVAFAQKTTEEPGKVQQIRAVEHGPFVETDIGVGGFVTKLDERSYGLSLLTGLFAGYDVLPILSVAIGGIAMGAPVSQALDTPTPRGDLVFLAPMVQVQFALITTERNFLYVRGRAGFGFALPGTLGDKNNDQVEDDYGGTGPLFAGSVGFERYTKLRHFSLGINAGVLVVTAPSVGVGITVTPTLKYTF